MRKVLLFSLLPIVLLPACSTAPSSFAGKALDKIAGNRSGQINTATTLSELQKEYNNYQYSDYVKNSLVAPAPIVNVAEVAKVTRYDGNLKAVKRQLVNRKKRSAAHIDGVRNQSGIYNPSRALQQHTARLNSKNKAESWLKNHSSLDAVLTMVLKNNLDIQSAQQQAKANLAKYDQVAYLDDMLSQYASFTKGIKLTGSTQKHKQSVSAGFPFPALLSLKSSIIDQAVESSRLQSKQTVQDVITNTRIAYTELQYAQQEKGIIRKKIKLLKSLKEELKSNYATSSAELSGILQADIKIAENQNKLQLAKDKQQAEQAKLNALLHLSPLFALGKLDTLKVKKLKGNIQQLIKTGKVKRVEIARLRSDLEKMKRIIQLSEKRFYPDFDAGYSRFQSGKFTTRPKVKQNNFFAKNDAYLTETRQKYKALQSKIKALENKTADDIQQVYSKYQSQERNRALYQNKVIPKAKTSLDVTKSLYETGESSYLKIINAQKEILNYRLKSLMALKGINVNIIKLTRFVGAKEDDVRGI